MGCLNAFGVDELCHSHFNHVIHVPREAMEMWAAAFCRITTQLLTAVQDDGTDRKKRVAMAARWSLGPGEEQ